MEKSHLEFDVIIVGGGIVGATLAACLKHTDLQIAIIEAQPLDVVTKRQRAYAMSLLSQGLFQDLGIWEAIASQSGKYQKIQLSDENFAGVIKFSRQDLRTEFLGFSGQHQVVLEALQNNLADHDNVTWFCPTQVTNIQYQKDQAFVALSNESEGDFTIRGSVIVGADGARSLVRQRAGITTKGWKYGQSCVTCVVEHTAPSNDVAFERFWSTGPMGILPLTNNRCQIVWTNPHTTAQHLKSLPPEDFLQHLEQHTGPQLGPLKLMGDRQIFPVQLMQGDRYVQHRLALVGDAAHCCHPVGGQGLNLGIRDAAALAQTLVEAHHQGKDLGQLKVLKRYERWRKLENFVMLGFTDFLNRLFSNRILPLMWLRRFGLIVMAKFTPFRLFALKLMTGQKGRQPRILA